MATKRKKPKPTASDYLGALKDVFVVNPKNSPGATLGRAAYDYLSNATPQSVAQDIRSGVQDAKNWAVRESRQLQKAPIGRTLQLMKSGYVDPLLEPFRVFQQSAEARAGGDEGTAQRLAAAVPLAVFSAVNPELRGAGKLATKAATGKATKAAERKAVSAAEKTGVRDLSKAEFDPAIYKLRKKTEVPALKNFVVKTARRKPEPDGPVLGVEDIAGRPVMVGMSDRLGSGETITHVGNNALDIPVHEYGGQDFAYHNPYAWAVSTPQTATAMMNTAAALKKKYGVNPLWMPYRMGGTGTDFSKTTGELMMSQANSGLGLSDRKRVDALIGQFIPDFKGIDNPAGYEQFGALGGDERKALQEALDNTFASEGGLSLPITRALIAAPNQRAKPSFFLQNVMEIDPDKEVVFDPTANPTYGYNIPGQIIGTLGPDINAAEVVGPMLAKKYEGLGDLSVFRGQNLPLSEAEWRRQQKEYAAEKAAYDAKVAAGKAPKKPPRAPVRVGNTSKFMQAGTFGLLDDAAAQAIADRLSKLAGE